MDWSEEIRQARDVPLVLGDWQSVWRVCESYRLVENEEAEKYGGLDRDGSKLRRKEKLPAYIEPKYPAGREDRWRTVNPLEKDELLIAFVRAHEEAFAYASERARAQERTTTTKDYWMKMRAEFVDHYGLLGLDGGMWLGGRSEAIDGYMLEGQRAARLLRLYEAVLSGDEEAALVALGTGENQMLDDERLDAEGRWYEATPLERALVEVKLETEAQIHRHCRTVLALPEHSHDLAGVRSGWEFDSLLGPMYLQLLWHVAAQREVRRCLYCHRPIPNPRANQRFCREREGIKDKCRYDYNYHYGDGKSSKETRKKRREARKKSTR
jgi:hypothetical protein